MMLCRTLTQLNDTCAERRLQSVRAATTAGGPEGPPAWWYELPVWALLLYSVTMQEPSQTP